MELVCASIFGTYSFQCFDRCSMVTLKALQFSRMGSEDKQTMSKVRRKPPKKTERAVSNQALKKKRQTLHGNLETQYDETLTKQHIEKEKQATSIANNPLPEADKEVLRLQGKVLRLQEKIAKLQHKVAELQGLNI